MGLVAGIAMVKDEADVIGTTLARMVREVDFLIVADNMSGDGTRDILRDLERRMPIEVLDDREPAYYQSAKMSELAERAAAQGAQWVVPFDADETWYSPFGRVADVLDALPESCAIATAELYDHVATGLDPAGGTHLERIGWRRTAPAPLHKVACRPVARVTIHQGNHGADFGNTETGRLVVRHFPYRSAEQFVRKAKNGAAAYAAAVDLPETDGAHWRDYGRLLETHGREALESVFREHFWCADPRARGLIFDPCPSP